MENQTFDGTVLKLWIEDGILCGIYKIKIVDLASAQQAAKERLEFTNRRDVLSLVDYSMVKTTTKEARDYLSLKESSEHITAMALLISSPVQSMMANFYLTINRPSFPFKVFSDRTKAKNWLSQYAKQDPLPENSKQSS